MASVIVTGAAGFTGSHLVAYLLKCGHRIVAIDNKVCNLKNISRTAEITLIQRDLMNDDNATFAKLLLDHQPEWVFHCAAVTSKDADSSSLESMFNANVIGTLRLLEVIRSANLNTLILVPGSSSQYGLVPDKEQPIQEETPFRPANMYAAAKIAQEKAALHFHEFYGLRVICSRTFNLTGPGERPDFVCSSFAKQIARIEAGLQNPVIKVGNLLSKRDWLDVRDAIRAYVLLANGGKPGQVYNVSSGSARSVQHVLDILLSFTRVHVEVVQDAMRMQINDVSNQISDSSKLRKTTGWEPTISFEESLRDLLNYWREYLNMEKIHELAR